MKDNEGRDKLNEALSLMMMNFPDHFDCVDFLHEFIGSDFYADLNKRRRTLEVPEGIEKEWFKDYMEQSGYKLIPAEQVAEIGSFEYSCFCFDAPWGRYVMTSYVDAWINYKGIKPSKFVSVLTKEDFRQIAYVRGYNGTHIEIFIEKMEKTLKKRVRARERRKKSDN